LADPQDFALGTYPQSSVLLVYSERDEVELNPEYQRISGIWTREKRQLLIDTIINGFDIPKLYFHEFYPAVVKGGKKYRYAIIDGKQRLQTIWDFINDDLPLSEEFKYLRDPSIEAGGLLYSQLGTKYPQIKTRFDGTLLHIVTIRTNEIELIEEMFSRLNEAVPLNAPEKRNAFGGPLPKVIRDISEHTFFKKHIPFTDKRYRHRELAAKFLYLEFMDRIANTKKGDLDDFVKEYKARAETHDFKDAPAVAVLRSRTERVLDAMSGIFKGKDELLRQVGMITLHYHLFRLVGQKKVGGGKTNVIKRDMLKTFDLARDANRMQAEKTSETDAKVDTKLLEFDKHSQTPNDAYAIRIRLGILLQYLKKTFGVAYDSTVLDEPD
jgi:hypothetical protein